MKETKKSCLFPAIASLVAIAVGNILTVPAYSAPSTEAPADTTVLDTSVDPGCGVKGYTKEQKIKRNYTLAKMYFQTYVEAVHTGKMMGWHRWGCFADPWILVPGTFRPYGDEMKMPGAEGDGGLGEMQAYWKAIPDLAAVPGTFVAHAWENGVWSRQNWIGHAKKDGRKIELWETELLLVNDEGKITRWEFWGDTIGAEDAIMETHGIDIKNLPLKEYGEAIKKKLQEAPAAK